MYGYPGSGKSTFARLLAEELENTVHINYGKIQAELSEEFRNKAINNPEDSRALTDYIGRQLLDAGLSIVLDVPITKKAERRKITLMAKKTKTPLVMVWLQIDSNSAFERVRKRDKRKLDEKYARNYTRGEFESVINSSQNPADEDYVVISGKHTFNTQKAAVFNKLQKMGVLSTAQSVQKRIKPELVNLIPQSFRGKDELRRRDISIR
jgi:predicted kinase